MEATNKPYTFDRMARILITTVCVAVTLSLIDYLSGVLLPFAVACLLAYILNPLVEQNRKILRVNGRLLPTIITLFEISAIITLSCYILLPYIISEVHETINMLKEYSQMSTNGKYISEAIHAFLREHINVDDLSRLLTREQWINILSTTANNTWSFVGTTLSIIFTIASWIIVLLYLVFILIDYHKIKTGLFKAIPSKYQDVMWELIQDIANVMQRYFRGQSLIAFLVGILFSIGFIIIGLPLGLIFGIFIGLLNMVPYLQLISLPIALILCLIDSMTTGGNFWIMLSATIAVYCVVQLIQDLYLTPKIMGKEMGINPVFIFLSLSIWGTLLGFIGLIIALPLTTLLVSYYKQYILHQVKSNDKSEQPSSDATPT